MSHGERDAFSLPIYSVFAIACFPSPSALSLPLPASLLLLLCAYLCLCDSLSSAFSRVFCTTRQIVFRSLLPFLFFARPFSLLFPPPPPLAFSLPLSLSLSLLPTLSQLSSFFSSPVLPETSPRPLSRNPTLPPTSPEWKLSTFTGGPSSSTGTTMQIRGRRHPMASSTSLFTGRRTSTSEPHGPHRRSISSEDGSKTTRW